MKQLYEQLQGRRFSIDSRKISPQDVYVALPGNQVDGHDFVEEAFSKGAAFAIVSRKGLKGPCLYVEDTLKTLQDLAKIHFAHHLPKTTVAITGSLGKTTTKEFLATLLEGSFTVFKSPGNANSQAGLPLAILNELKGEEVAVLEMGMTHFNQIAKLVEIAPPDIALITKVSMVHIENFDSIQDIALAKSEIMMHPKTNRCIYDPEIDTLIDLSNKGSCKKEKFSFDPLFLPFVPFLGKHNLHNLGAAIAVARVLGLSDDVISSKIPLLKLPKMRLEEVEHQGVLFINDSYNASFESMQAALKAIPLPKQGGKKIAVLGSMLELGVHSSRCHQLIQDVALAEVDHAFFYGNEWSETKWQDHKSIILELKKMARPGDVVLIKGSNGTKMWEVMEGYIRS